ncbi:hypothetical protein JTE90_004621 [Oedothorax gibbosus]|uniref:Uncharacterized protein n=1 Tax=Oedothorax gibbosus TaxID=931172 RepID=A0AAV6UP88_9ARAC|nr:hypothetical protein JTE90_004621 [Oedothorax gibbosus]
MSAPSPDKTMDAGQKPAASSDQDASGADDGAMQKAFDAYAKLGGNIDGKIKSDSVQKWIKKAGISEVSDDDCKKHFGKDGGLDFKEMKQGIEKLAKEKKLEMKDIMKKLSSSMPSGEDIKGKMDDIKSKLGGEKK